MSYGFGIPKSKQNFMVFRLPNHAKLQRQRKRAITLMRSHFSWLRVAGVRLYRGSASDGEWFFEVKHLLKDPETKVVLAAIQTLFDCLSPFELNDEEDGPIITLFIKLLVKHLGQKDAHSQRICSAIFWVLDWEEHIPYVLHRMRILVKCGVSKERVVGGTVLLWLDKPETDCDTVHCFVDPELELPLPTVILWFAGRDSSAALLELLKLSSSSPKANKVFRAVATDAAQLPQFVKLYEEQQIPETDVKRWIAALREAANLDQVAEFLASLCQRGDRLSELAQEASA